MSGSGGRGRAGASAISRASLAPFYLLGPAYLWLLLTIFLPLSAMLLFSFLSVAPFGGREAEFTFRHYAAFMDKEFYRTLTWRSLKLGLDVTFWCMVIGYPAALALARHVPGRWREALFLLIVLPFWSNALVRIFSWTMVLRGGGLIDQSVQVLWPEAPSLGILFSYPAIVVGLVHSFLPYMILTCYLSLQAIETSLEEAALSLGASPLTVFRRVTLPLSLPGLLVGVVLIFVPVIGSFMEPRILGGPEGIMLGTVIEDQFTVVFNWPLGAALSFILLAIVLLLMAIAAPVLGRPLAAATGR
ncbi:MAG TPA: ABC transporter permease [Alphaproteobacteria bacterium]|nr:ABC transporter permease [Alphaproteobacteria bacterium]